MGRWDWVLAVAAVSPVWVAAEDLELDVDTPSKREHAETGPAAAPFGAAPAPGASGAVSCDEPQPWYERLSLRGYTQLRYAELLDDELETYRHYADRSVAHDQSLLIRRARLVISGALNDRVSITLQPDLAVNPRGVEQTHFVQLRDAYADVYLGRKRDWRVRLGQSKVPYGFENLQSSSNRLPLDRSDALNSCCKDERDVGAFFYWTPPGTSALFEEIADRGLKHTGNYGLIGLGLYNGQGANRIESNGDFHWVARISYPWRSKGGQLFEVGTQMISGRFVPAADAPAVLQGAPAAGYPDKRFGLSAVLYPQPFGLQAEWNWGEGPALSRDRARIEVDVLEGGYLQAMLRFDTPFGTLMPYLRWQRFEGAMKFERNAPRIDATETDLGVEWQVMPALEVTSAYVIMDRTDILAPPYRQVSGNLLRVQVQWNY